MLDVTDVLNELMINTTSPIGAINDVTERLDGDNKAERATRFIKQVFGIEKEFADGNVGNATAKRALEMAVRYNCTIDDPAQLIFEAERHAEAFVMKPDNNWMFISDPVPEKKELVVTPEEAPTPKKKRPSGPTKQQQANDIWKELVVDAVEPMAFNDLVPIVAKRVETSEAGAKTMLYAARRFHDTANN